MVPKEEMKKIRSKIMLLVILATMGVSIMCSILSMMITKNSTMDAIEQNLSETTELAALAAHNMISTYTLIISEIATNAVLKDQNLTPAEKQTYLMTKVDAYYMRAAGMADTNGYDAIHNLDISQEPFFQAALQGKCYISTPYIDGEDMYLIISAPVIEDDTVLSIIYFQCDTTILSSIVENIQIGQEGEAYILDKEGNTIAHGDIQVVLDQENIIHLAAENPQDKDYRTLAAIESKMVAGETGVEQFSYSKDNSSNIQGYAPISGTDGWSIAVTIDLDEFMQYAHKGNMVQFIFCVILCFIIILISMFVVNRVIAGPITKCTKRIQALSAGDLHNPVPKINSKDELRTLSESTNQLVGNFKLIVDEIGAVLSSIANGDLTKDSACNQYPGDFKALHDYIQIIDGKLNRTMSGIVQSAVQVSGSAAQMASSSSILSQGAVSQSSAIEELSSTIEGIEHDAKTTAQLTEQAKTSVTHAGSMLQESNRQIEALNDAMNQITVSSNKISNIIDTIEDIALQTNILALNASVEAARAGAAGKGFAVVAGEIRDLANKSNLAAKATMELIHNSIAAVGSGNEIVEQVTDSVTQAVSIAAEATEQMTVVAEAIERQTSAIEQVTLGIEQISNVVQSNSASAQESAATSQELSGQAEMLKNLMSSFKLRKQKNEPFH